MNRQEFMIRLTELIGKAANDRLCDSNVLDLRVYIHKGGYNDIYEIFDIDDLDGVYNLIKNERGWYVDIYENPLNYRESWCTDYSLINYSK